MAPVKPSILIAVSISLSIPVGIVACSSGDDSTQTPTQSVGGNYHGLLTGPHESAVLDVVIGSATSQPTSYHRLDTNTPTTVTGTITRTSDGQTISLQGSYDPATGVLSLAGTTGTGDSYGLTGTSSSSGFSGTYNGPSGAGSFTLASSVSGPATVYCGTASSTSGGSPSVWNLVIDASGNAMGAYCAGDTCGALVGTVNDTAITLSGDGQVSATGTVQDGAAQGTWTAAQGGDSGTWSGSTAACESADAGG